MYCYVSGCPNGSASSKEGKKSRPIVQIFFRAPEDEALFKLWQKAVPESGQSFSRDDKLCECHFQKSEVVLYTETKLPNGNVRRLPASEPKLKPGTVPSIFPTMSIISDNVGTADTSKSGNHPEKQKVKRKYSIDDFENSPPLDNEKFAKGKGRKLFNVTQDKQMSASSEKRRKTIKGEALMVTNATNQGGSELFLDKSGSYDRETADLSTHPCGIRLVPLEMLLESNPSSNKASVTSTPGKSYRKTPIKKLKDNTKILSNTPKSSLSEKKVKKVLTNTSTPVLSATRVSARISSKIKQGKMPKYLQGTSMDIDRINDEIDEEKPNIEELEKNNTIELYHEGSDYPEVISIKTEPEEEYEQQELIDPVTGELNTSVNDQNTEVLPQEMFADNGVHPRITGVISLSDLTNATPNDEQTAERVAVLLEREIERITDGRILSMAEVQPEDPVSNQPYGTNSKETSTPSKAAEQESSTAIKEKSCDIEKEVEKIVEGRDKTPERAVAPLTSPIEDNPDSESDNLPSNDGQTAPEEERTSDINDIPLTNDDTSSKQPEKDTLGSSAAESSSDNVNVKDPETLISDRDIEKEIERIVEGTLSESEVAPTINEASSSKSTVPDTSPVKETEEKNNDDLVKETEEKNNDDLDEETRRKRSVDNIEEEIAKLLEESPSTLVKPKATSKNVKDVEHYLSSDSDQDPTWTPGPVEVSDENDTDPGCGIDSHDSDDDKEKDKENISKKKRLTKVSKLPKSIMQKQNQQSKGKASASKKVSFQVSQETSSSPLISGDTLQQILNQLKLPLTSPVTFRIAPQTKGTGKQPAVSASTLRKTGANEIGPSKAIIFSLDKDGKPLTNFRTLLSIERSKRCEGLLALKMYEGLGKIKKCFKFSTEVKSLRDEIQYKKLCYITKECLREVRDSRNAKTNVGKLTFKLKRKKKNAQPEVPSTDQAKDSPNPTNVPAEEINMNAHSDENPETAALECVTVDSTIEDSYEIVPVDEKQG